MRMACLHRLAIRNRFSFVSVSVCFAFFFSRKLEELPTACASFASFRSPMEYFKFSRVFYWIVNTARFLHYSLFKHTHSHRPVCAKLIHWIDYHHQLHHQIIWINNSHRARIHEFGLLQLPERLIVLPAKRYFFIWLNTLTHNPHTECSPKTTNHSAKTKSKSSRRSDTYLDLL